MELFNNLVVFLAKKFSNRGEPLEDIVQVGYIGLLQAIERFEPQRGLEFSTFATPTIAGRTEVVAPAIAFAVGNSAPHGS